MEEQNIPSDILKTRINTQDKEDHAKPANAPHQKEKHAQNMQNTKKIRENQEADWGKYSQETMKENLIRASIFITIFEYFKNVIIQNLREVYTDFGLPRAEYDQNKITKTSHKFNEETFNSKDFKKDISLISSKSSIISIKEKYYDNKPLSDTSPNLKKDYLFFYIWNRNYLGGYFSNILFTKFCIASCLRSGERGITPAPFPCHISSRFLASMISI